MGQRFFLLAVLMTVISLPSRAASFSRKVVVVRPGEDGTQDAWPEAEDALREELSLLGFAVQIVQDTALQVFWRQERFAQIAAQTGADALMRISRSREMPLRVGVFIYETTEQTVTTKQWIASNPEDPDGAVIAGLRAAETLRACFREADSPVENPVVGRTPAPAPSEPSEPSRAEQLGRVSEPSELSRAEQLSRVSVGGSVSIATSFRGTGVQSGFRIVLDWRPLRFFGIALDAAYLPFGKKIEAGDTTSLLDLVLFRARAVWHMINKGKLRPAFLIGGGSLMVIAEGVESDGRRLTRDLTKVGYVGGAVSLSLVAAAWLRITAEVGLGAALPGVTLSHGESFAATIGRPLLDAALQVEFGRF